MSEPVNLLPLPPQPEGVAWPTDEWPTGELDSRVDQSTLEKMLDHAFSLPEPEDLDRTHAVVAIQHGKIVAERYAHDVEPKDLKAHVVIHVVGLRGSVVVREDRLSGAESLYY